MKKIVSFVITVVMVLSMLNISTVQAEESWMWPTSVTTITQNYKSGGVHKGLDIGQKSAYGKAPIYASKSGKVVLSYDGCIGCKSDYGDYKDKGYGNNCRHNKSCGNYVIIDHGSGVYSRYLHLYWNGVAKQGTSVKQGDIIGYMGSTGSSTGTHLHFDIWTGGTGASGGTVLGGKTINTNTSQISYIYKGAGHTHSYTYKTESSHPHAEYRECSCGEREYTGKQVNNSSCKSCYPLGSVSFKREVKKTDKTVTFYRNDVVNANSYTINYIVGSTEKNVNMPERSLTLEDMRSGEYIVKLIVKNTRTGEEKTVAADGFSILNTYKVNYDANGGTNAPPSQEKIQNQNMTITTNTPIRTGYVFIGWARSKNATQVQYRKGDIYDKNSDVTLYAIWEPEVYTITFDANGGKGGLESITMTYGNTIKMPNSVVKDGYYLKGWSDNKTTTIPEYKIGKDYKVSCSTTLYAVWGESTWSGDVAESFFGGNGSEKDPYQISNASELALLAKKVNSQTEKPTEKSYYILTDNIDLAYAEWVPIGLSELSHQKFYDNFDGNNYTISGLYISSDDYMYYGLFGYSSNANIENLTITGDYENINFADKNIHMGGLLGYGNTTQINNINCCYFDISNITASNYDTGSSKSIYIGNVIGYLYYGSINNCTVKNSSISIENESVIGYLGGIAGNVNGSISNCNVHNENVLFGRLKTTRSLWLGGIVGGGGSRITNCFVNANRFTYNQSIDGAVFAGGICGTAELVNNCSVKFTNKELIAFNGNQLPYSIYITTTDVNGLGVGKLGGISADDATIKNCKYDGASMILVCKTIRGWDYPSVGGICGGGVSGTNISNCVSNVDGILYCSGPGQYIFAGGIVGCTISSNGKQTLKNLLSITDSITAKNTKGTVKNTETDGSTSYTSGGFAGDIGGFSYTATDIGEALYTNDNLTVDATSYCTYIATTKSNEKIKTRVFQKNLLGLGEYTTLSNLDTDNSAVWVLKDDELPELYYNCLNNIKISEEIENGTVTVDKTQAVDGETVTVTAIPDENYVVNKIYVNGEEQNATFIMDGDCEVYVTFAEKIAEYQVTITEGNHSSGMLINADANNGELMSLFATSDGSSLTAEDGTEISVNADADADYAVEAIYVNGEEIVGNNFILTKDTEVSVDVTNISTEITAVTGDAENVSDYSAVLNGSISGDGDGISKYIRYWSADNTDTVYTTEVESGEGDYSVTLLTLDAETTYYYQMTEYGEIKSFTTAASLDEEFGTDGDADPQPLMSITDLNVKTMGEYVLVDVATENANDYATVYIVSYDDNKKLSTIQTVELTDGVGQMILPLGNIKTIKALAWWTDAAYPLCVDKEYVIQ